LREVRARANAKVAQEKLPRRKLRAPHAHRTESRGAG
jgi:hypothetical protein